MDNAFYDPLVEAAGPIAEEYGTSTSISDVIGLLLQAGRDEARVRRALDAAAGSEEARAARSEGRQFDLVECARELLKGGE
ncbi:MAG: hypothetical protein ACJ78Q_11580 [Chloroflexia bacterium]